MAWSFPVDLPDDGGTPLFLRIARALADDVRRGRLRPGDALPGSRTLAETLGVHRNTVLSAYRELIAEGWIESRPARGVFVSSRLPDVAPRRFSSRAHRAAAVAARPGFDLPARSGALEDPPYPEDVGPRARRPMTLAGGVPDVRLVPATELARAVRRVLRRQADEVLAYGSPQGPTALRRALAEMLARTRGLPATEDDVLVTRGSQMGLDLAARALVAPGDVVAVEALGYRPAWEALAGSGADLAPVTVDEGGIDVDALAKLAARRSLRAVYVTPHHQYPTTVTLSAERRLALLDLAARARFAVLEDDYDHEFHYEGRPVLPLASADAHGVVVYVGTLSKVLAPGLRIGFVVAPGPVLARMTARRRAVDRQGDHLLEHAVADLLEDGTVARHIRRTRRVYAARRDRFADLLRRELGDVLSFRLPTGGTAIWAEVAPRVAVEPWAERALREGVSLQVARRFGFDGRARPFLRLGFAQHEAAEAREAVRRLQRALPRRA